MRHVPCVLLAATLSACASQQAVATRARASQRYVLVKGGAMLRARPDEAAPGVAVASPSTFRRVRERGPWVEVETVAAPQCNAVVAPPAGMRLRFYVRGADLGEVLSRPLTLTGPNGSLTALPGVAAHAGATAVELEHAGLRLTLAQAPSMGREHPASRAMRTSPRAERLAPGTSASLPDGVVAEVARDAAVYVSSRRASIEGARVAVVAPCVRFEGTVPERAVLPVIELDVDEAEGDAAPRWTLRRGAALRWPDGAPAGRATAAVELSDEGRAVGDARCFRVPLRVEGAAGPALATEVCVAAADAARSPSQ
jgi:hypothetical protein